MVFGLLTSVAAVPAIVGTTEAIRQGQRQNAREQHRGRKTELAVSLPRRDEQWSGVIDGGVVVLSNGKLYVDTGTSRLLKGAHPFTGYFLPPPDQLNLQYVWRQQGHPPKGEGLVSTITDDPPILNWIYVDKDTHEVKYGIRAEAQDHLMGPFGVTEGVHAGSSGGGLGLGGGRRVLFQGWEGWVLVEEELPEEDVDSDKYENESNREDEGQPKEDKVWALYFDVRDDGLRSGERIGAVPGRRNMLEVELTRRERKRTRRMAVEERVDRLQRRRELDENNAKEKGKGLEEEDGVSGGSLDEDREEGAKAKREAPNDDESDDDRAQPLDHGTEAGEQNTSHDTIGEKILSHVKVEEEIDDEMT